MQFPFKSIEFTKSGELFNINDKDSVLAWIRENQLTDLLILSHGWNNDKAEADETYQDVMGFIAEEMKKIPDGAKKYGVIGIYWPSKKFADKDLIPGGGAAGVENAEEKKLAAILDVLAGEFSDNGQKQVIDQLRVAGQRLTTDPNAPAEFVRKVGTLLQSIHQRSVQPEDDPGTTLSDQEEPKALLVRIAEAEAMGDSRDNPTGGLSSPVGQRATNISGGGAAGGLGVFEGMVTGARNLLNLTTYYTMKERAGNVGQKGMQPLLTTIIASVPKINIHLVGHSFGGRVMASAVATLPQGQAVNTLVLLQAAFSHHGFSNDFDGKGGKGLFRPAIDNKKVKGAIVISHTQNDKAVGKAYAIASRLANQTAQGFGGPDDKFGGIGANGAQRSGANSTFRLRKNTPYIFQAGTIYNLNADDSIKGHSDIRSEAVASAIVHAIHVKP